MHTLHTKSLARLALQSSVLDDDATVNGATVDLGMFKNNFRSVLFVVTAGTITDGTHTFSVQHSDNGTDWADVPADRIQGALPALDSGDSNTVEQFGYLVQTQRYVRLRVTTDDSTNGGAVSAVVLLSNASTSPPARA